MNLFFGGGKYKSLILFNNENMKWQESKENLGAPEGCRTRSPLLLRKSLSGRIIFNL